MSAHLFAHNIIIIIIIIIIVVVIIINEFIDISRFKWFFLRIKVYSFSGATLCTWSYNTKQE